MDISKAARRKHIEDFLLPLILEHQTSYGCPYTRCEIIAEVVEKEIEKWVEVQQKRKEEVELKKFQDHVYFGNDIHD